MSDLTLSNKLRESVDKGLSPQEVLDLLKECTSETRLENEGFTAAVKLILAAGVRAEDIAFECGVNRSTIDRWLAGKNVPQFYIQATIVIVLAGLLQERLA